MLRRRLLRRPLIRWSVALALAALTASVLSTTLGRADDARREWGDRRSVAVATHALRAGSVVTAGDVEVRSWPAALVPSGALDAAPVGQTVRADVVAGEALVGARVTRPGTSGAAALIPDGWRALAVPVAAGALALSPGDVVDLLATADPTAPGGGGPTVTIAERAIVVAVSERAITVAVPSRLAPDVAHAAATGAITPALVP